MEVDVTDTGWRAFRGAPAIVFLLCLGAWTLTNIDQSFFGYAIPALRREFGVELSEIGWLLSASAAAAVLGSIVIGLIADRYGRKWTLILTLALSELLVGLQGFAQDIWVLSALRLASFSLSNAVAAIVMTMTSEAAPPRVRGLMTGFAMIGYPLGWFIASILAVPLMAQSDWRTMFWVDFAAIPFALVLWRWLPESQQFEHLRAGGNVTRTWSEQIATLFAPALRWRTIACTISCFAFGAAYAATAFFFPTFFHEVRGYSEADGTWIVGLSYGIGLVGYLFSATVSEYVLTRRDTLIAGYGIGSLALLGLIWLPSSYNQDVIWFSVVVIFLYGSQSTLGTWISELFPTDVRVTGSAVAGSGGLYFGFAVSPPLVSMAVDHFGWQWAMTMVACPFAILAGLVLLATVNRPSGLVLEDITQASEVPAARL